MDLVLDVIGNKPTGKPSNESRHAWHLTIFIQCMMQEGPLAAAGACWLILMVHDAFLSAAMEKRRDGMHQHLAKQMPKPKQMHGLLKETVLCYSGNPIKIL
jgi:hypothetical protein